MRPGQLEPHLVFTAAGRLLSSTRQGDTLLWNAHTGRILRRFPVGGLPAVSANGRRVALGINSPSLANPSAKVTVLDLRTGRHPTLSANLPGVWIRSIAFTPDGSRVVAGATDGVHVWNAASGAIAETYTGQSGRRAVMTLDPRGATVISGGQDGSVAVFDLSGRRRLGRAFTWNRPAQSCPSAPCAIVSPQGLMATDQGDGTIALVDLHTLRLTRTLPARNGAFANGLSFLPDGRTLVTGGTNRHVTFWDLTTDRVTRTLRLADPVWWTAVSPDSRLLAVQTQAANSLDSRVDMIQIATGKVVLTKTVHDGYGGVEFSRDGHELVALGCCAPRSTVVAWDTHTGAQLFRHGSGVQVTSFDLSPDARLVAVGTEDGKVLLLNARTGRQDGAPIQVAAGLVGQLAFSPDGTSFAIASNDGTASLWDLRSRKRLGNPLPPLPGAVPGVVFEPSGRLLVGYVSNAYQWPTDVGTWEQFACQVAGRNLSRAEWRDLLPNRAYQRVCV
jgi:WD40 repeat protein